MTRKTVVRNELRFGPIVMQRRDHEKWEDGKDWPTQVDQDVYIAIDECPESMWVWVRPMSWNFGSPAEELAKMLAVIDGTFEVRRLK